ncbi:hypothetical protein VI817_008846 [Penicillium citrinum]|nr:hypothetical protein VI817_008846 [Penicillium citrinum]
MATHDSSYRAGLYDIGFAQEDTFASDGAVYWEAYREIRTNAPRHNSPYFFWTWDWYGPNYSRPA